MKKENEEVSGLSGTNEEDYLDNLLKSMSEKEDSVEDDIDIDEKLIKEQVEEAVNKNDNSSINIDAFLDEYDETVSGEDAYASNDTDEPSDDLKSLDESFSDEEINDNNFNGDIADTGFQMTPDEVARMAMEDNEANIPDNEEEMDKAAEEALDAMLEDVMPDDINNVDMSSEKNESLDSGLTNEELERLMNMELDNILDDVANESGSLSKYNYSTGEGNFSSDSEEENEGEVSSLDDLISGLTFSDEEIGEEQAVTQDSDDISAAAALNMVNSSSVDSTDEESSENENSIKNKKNHKNKSKKKGFLEIVKNILFEKTEADDDGSSLTVDDNNIDKPKDENEQIISDMDKEGIDSGLSEASKKGLFARIKYKIDRFKEKQSKEEAEEEAAEEEEDLLRQKKKEEKKAANAEKKEQLKKEKSENPKKDKKNKQAKPKKVKKAKEPQKPGDVLKIKPVSIIMFILFVSGVVLLVEILSSTVNYNSRVSMAKSYYQSGEYHKAYSQLIGLDLNETDKRLFEQTSTIMYVQRQYEAYNNYVKLDDNVNAIDSLIKGISRYNRYYDDAVDLGVDDKFDAIYDVIISTLSNTYNISEESALLLSAQSESDFTGYYFKIKAYGEAAQLQ